MIFDRATSLDVCVYMLYVCIHLVRSDSGLDTTMHDEFGKSKILGLFVLYTTLSRSENRL